MKLTIASATRYIVLLLALINQWLADKGLSPIPVDEETISKIITTVVGLYVAYKDNPITKEGKQANDKLKELKYEKKQPTNGKAPSDFDASNEGQK
ncbi:MULTISPECIES: phage holin [Staphylococcus]|uniref:phage holin n=1 Tax=Staphylococcus TaxID=1279 RepID=UPI002DB68ECA|nr:MULTISPECIES: phage holin [Staphylococcus]MEB6046050.1 phage holin [Staphylococcus pseudoxylosus]MEB8099149.1 phage holin [Staphylococcus xylosus]